MLSNSSNNICKHHHGACTTCYPKIGNRRTSDTPESNKPECHHVKPVNFKAMFLAVHVFNGRAYTACAAALGEWSTS